MPEWIHNRAMNMLPDMKKTYGPKKAKQVAFAVATQQAHAVGAAPKTFHGKPFGTPQGKRVAKQKFDQPSKMQKAATFLDILMGKAAQEQPQQSEHRGPGFTITDHTGQQHWLDASTIHSKMDLEKAVTPLMSECPHGIVREKIEEGWKALAESRRAAGQPVKEESAEPKEEKTAAGAVDQGSQPVIGSSNRDREILRPTITPSVMTSSQVPLTPPSGLGQTNTSIAAAEPTEDEVAEFFKRHPTPPDDVLHRWAISRGWEPDEVEGRAYRLATSHAQFTTGGKSQEEGTKPSDFDPGQVAKGMKVEKEHTPEPEGRLKITTDHLTEDPKYYNDPLFASDLAKKAVLEGFKKLFKEPPKRKPRGEIIDLADEAASRSAVKWASLAPVIPHFLDGLVQLGARR